MRIFKVRDKIIKHLCVSVLLPSVELSCGLGVTLVLMLLLFVVYHVFWLELLLIYRSWFGSDERHSGESHRTQVTTVHLIGYVMSPKLMNMLRTEKRYIWYHHKVDIRHQLPVKIKTDFVCMIRC